MFCFQFDDSLFVYRLNGQKGALFGDFLSRMLNKKTDGSLTYTVKRLSRDEEVINSI